MSQRGSTWLPAGILLVALSSCASPTAYPGTLTTAVPPSPAARAESPVQLVVAQRSPPQPPGLGYLHPLQLPSSSLRDRALAMPCWKRDRVHTFLVNGLDPLWWGNLNGTGSYLRWCGFANTHCVQLTEVQACRKAIRQLRQARPDARIVLLGYSLGANCVRWLAHQLRHDGVRLDLLVYLGGDTIFDGPRSRPSNCDRVLNVRAHGLIPLGYDAFFNGDDLTGAANVRLEARHICLPSDRKALELLLRELVVLAESVAEPVPPARLERPRPLPTPWLASPAERSAAARECLADQT